MFSNRCGFAPRILVGSLLDLWMWNHRLPRTFFDPHSLGPFLRAEWCQSWRPMPWGCSIRSHGHLQSSAHGYTNSLVVYLFIFFMCVWVFCLFACLYTACIGIHRYIRPAVGVVNMSVYLHICAGSAGSHA